MKPYVWDITFYLIRKMTDRWKIDWKKQSVRWIDQIDGEMDRLDRW